MAALYPIAAAHSVVSMLAKPLITTSGHKCTTAASITPMLDNVDEMKSPPTPRIDTHITADEPAFSKLSMSAVEEEEQHPTMLSLLLSVYSECHSQPTYHYILATLYLQEQQYSNAVSSASTAIDLYLQQQLGMPATPATRHTLSQMRMTLAIGLIQRVYTNVQHGDDRQYSSDSRSDTQQPIHIIDLTANLSSNEDAADVKHLQFTAEDNAALIEAREQLIAVIELSSKQQPSACHRIDPYLHLSSLQYHSKNIDEALRLAEVFALAHPQSVALMHHLTTLRICSGTSLSTAMYSAENTMKHTPDDYDVRKQYAILQLMHGNYNDALQLIQSLHTATPMLEVWILLAAAYQHADMEKEAIHAYTMIAELDASTDPDAGEDEATALTTLSLVWRFNYCTFMLQQAERSATDYETCVEYVDAAQQMLQRLVAQGVKSKSVLLQLLRCYHYRTVLHCSDSSDEQPCQGKAFEVYSQIMTADDHCIDACYLYSSIAISTNLPAEAIDMCSGCLRKFGVNLPCSEETDRNDQDYPLCIKPKNANQLLPVAINLGRALLAYHMHPLALDVFRSVENWDDTQSDNVGLHIAECYSLMDQTKDAVLVYHRLIRRAASKGKVADIAIYNNLALCYIGQQQYQDAEQCLSIAIQQNQHDVYLAANLIKCQTLHHQKDEAMKYLASVKSKSEAVARTNGLHASG